MRAALIVLGVIIYAAGWVLWETRYVVASDHFLRANSRAGSACAGIGALLMIASVLA